MVTRAPCVTNEWYHVFNRGTDKRIVFNDPNDYERFLMLTYTGNATNAVPLHERKRPILVDILNDVTYDRGDQLVEIGAYALMPNHVHFILKQVRDGGIARFMQKVFTGYTMYFNLKNERTGNLFSGTYKAKHISNDEYLKRALAYVMLNPAELFEVRWKEGIGDIAKIKKHLLAFPYASTQDFFGSDRVHGALISSAVLEEYFDEQPALAELLADAQEYYLDNQKGLDLRG